MSYELTTVYNRIARFYDLLDSPFETLIYKKMRQLGLTKLRNSKILEIGVGTGKNLKYLHPTNQITAIDLSEKMIKIAKRKNNGEKHVTFQLTKNEALPFGDETLDFVIVSFVIYLQPEPQKFVNEIIRVLKKKGRVIVLEYTVPDNQFSKIVAHLLTKFTKPLYGLDFHKIQTLPLLKENLKLIKIKKYMYKWTYVAVFEK